MAQLLADVRRHTELRRRLVAGSMTHPTRLAMLDHLQLLTERYGWHTAYRIHQIATSFR